jgi:hypothetical protein
LLKFPDFGLPVFVPQPNQGYDFESHDNHQHPTAPNPYQGQGYEAGTNQNNPAYQSSAPYQGQYQSSGTQKPVYSGSHEQNQNSNGNYLPPVSSTQPPDQQDEEELVEEEPQQDGEKMERK